MWYTSLNNLTLRVVIGLVWAIGCVVLGLLSSLAHATKPKRPMNSLTCAVPLPALEIAGLQPGMSEAQLLQQHPSARQVVLPINNVQYELNTADGLDDIFRQYGVTRLGHLGYNPRLDRLSSFSLGFVDGPVANYETELEVFKSRILRRFNVPQSGWKLTGNRYVYRCADYELSIVQDHGAEHTAVGPIVTLFTRYSPLWSDIVAEWSSHR